VIAQFSLRPIAQVWALLLLIFVSASWAQDTGFDAVLNETRKELAALQKTVRSAQDDAALLRLRDRTLELQEQLQKVSNDIAPQLAAIDQRIAELGTPPEGGPEPSEIAKQRRSLERQRAALDGQNRLAALLLLEAEQTLDEITGQRRALFQQHLSERARSPLGQRFWIELAANIRHDTQRVLAGAAELSTMLRATPFAAWVGALAATLVTLLVRAWLTHSVLGWLLQRESHRSARAFLYIVSWAVCGALIARWFVMAATDASELSERGETLVNTLVASAGFGTYIVALGATLVARCKPQWRLDVLPQAIAVKLRSFPTYLAIALVLTAIAEQAAALVSLSLAGTVALEAAMTLLLAGVHVFYLHRIAPAGRWPLQAPAADQTAPSLPIWASVVLAASWATLGVGVLCVLAGYVALGSFIVKQFSWAVIVSSTAYMVIILLGSIITRLLAPKGTDPSRYTSTSLILSARLQAAVLLSALTQIAVGFFALLLLLTPYGAGPAEFLKHAARAAEGLSIGSLYLRPVDLGRALLVLVLGFTAVRAAHRWLQQRYLPLTRMDAGMRESVASTATYVGYIVVVSLALSTLGVQLQHLAWVASALAVGIGFGLQAIVQNFVSGLILLAERPVKVGDWVSLGVDIEGDVRRINVRATEIQKADRSTVIVPNSEFITKAVRNVTYNSPLGLVQFKLVLPLTVDVERVRSELLQAFGSNTDILREPAPSVMIDGIDSANVIFNASAFVRSPRLAYATRSAVLFDALRRLRAAGIYAS
jgi:small-conductance mechanosensitive channel